MITDRLTNWYNLSKQYLFTYKAGFFNLSFLSNSPELMMKSFAKMPFVKFNAKEKKISTDTPFVKGESNFTKLEEGLWFLYSKMFYKNNVSFTPVYDNYSPSDYYCIVVNFIENSLNVNHYETNGVKVPNQSILFIKPKSDFLHCNFKGSNSKIYTLYFSEEWVQKNIINSPNVNSKTLELFENEAKQLINYNCNTDLFKEITNIFLGVYKNSKNVNFLELKKLSYQFLDLFFENLKDVEYYELENKSSKDVIKIRKIEDYLMSTIYNKFPGIDFLCTKFKISSTKIKKDFKLTFNLSIYQYYQSKQMQVALTYFEQGALVKDIAEKFNYQNVTKFSKAFQKYHNQLPSQIEILP